MVEKVGDTKTAKRILAVMTEKFDKNMSEKTTNMMRKISSSKGNLYKDVEEIKKKSENLEKGLNQLREIRKNKLISTEFVEEEIVIDVKHMNKGQKKMMLIDNAAPKSIVSSRWFDGYLQVVKVDEESVKRKSCARRFRMGKTVYLSKI